MSNTQSILIRGFDRPSVHPLSISIPISIPRSRVFLRKIDSPWGAADPVGRNDDQGLIRVPRELKERLREQARLQGVSLNQLIGYSLSREVSYLEARAYLERRLAGKSPEEIHQRFVQVMRKIEDRDVPEWDRMPEEP